MRIKQLVLSLSFLVFFVIFNQDVHAAKKFERAMKEHLEEHKH